MLSFFTHLSRLTRFLGLTEVHNSWKRLSALLLDDTGTQKLHSTTKSDLKLLKLLVCTMTVGWSPNSTVLKCPVVHFPLCLWCTEYACVGQSTAEIATSSSSLVDLPETYFSMKLSMLSYTILSRHGGLSESVNVRLSWSSITLNVCIDPHIFSMQGMRGSRVLTIM